MTGPQLLTVTPNLVQTAGDALKNGDLVAQLYGRSGLTTSVECMLAALRHLNSHQLVVMMTEHGLGGEEQRPVADLAPSLGIIPREILELEQGIVPRLRALILAQPRDWSGLPAWGGERVHKMLQEVRIFRPQDLSGETVLALAGIKRRWGIQATTAVNTALFGHGFRSLAAMNPNKIRSSALRERGLAL
jgi:hypothetical protein